MEKLRVGVLGLGKIAHIAQLPSLAGMDDVRIVAAHSRTRKSMEYASAKYNIEKLCDTFEQFLQVDMDCAFILTPKETHCEYALRLLNGGIDVFCEKPLGMTLGECRRIVAAARANDRILMVGFNRRYAPVYRKVKETFAGNPPHVVIAQKNRNGTEYRATLENAIHMVDLLRWFCGEPVEVQANSAYSDSLYEDYTTAQIRFDSGSSGILVASRKAGQWVEKVDAYGDDRSVFVSAPDAVTVVDSEKEVVTNLTALALGWPRVEDKMGFRQEVEHFIDCVVNRAQPLTSGEDAYKTHLLVHEILTKAGLPGIDGE